MIYGLKFDLYVILMFVFWHVKSKYGTYGSQLFQHEPLNF